MLEVIQSFVIKSYTMFPRFGVKKGIKSSICILLILSVFAFVCDSDRMEQGRFVRNIQNVLESEASLVAVSTPATNTDALAESRGSQSNPLEFRVGGRQSKRSARSYEIFILIILSVLVHVASYGGFGLYSLDIQSGEATILAYIMNQDGKK